MIEEFKELEMRKSGVIYNGTFEQIKKLYEVDPEKAGELAISAIEFVLCGDISSDDMLVQLMLEPTRQINQANQDKYDQKVSTARQKKIVDQKLDQIAELYLQGFKQREIGERLGLTQQIVSYRLGIIRSQYPELLDAADRTKDLQKNLPFTNDTKEFTKTLQKNLQTDSDFTKNTNNTKNTNFVPESFCKNDGVVEEDGPKIDWKKQFDF